MQTEKELRIRHGNSLISMSGWQSR